MTSHSPSHCLSSLTIAFMPSCLLILSLPIHAPHCPHTLKNNIPMHYYPPTMCNGVAHSPQHSVLIPTSVFSMVRWTPLSRHICHMSEFPHIHCRISAISILEGKCMLGQLWCDVYSIFVCVCTMLSRMVSILCAIIFQHPCPIDHWYQSLHTLHHKKFRCTSPSYESAMQCALSIV